MDKLQLMQTFVKVVENNSFAGAARETGISVPAISKQISRLEKGLGVQLMMRTTRKLELTEIGLAYFQHCSRLLQEAREGDSLILNMRKEPQGPLKVVTGRHFAKYMITPHLARFLEKYPSIQLDLELAERIPDLERENIDILIGMGLTAPGDIVQKKIMTTRYAYCASPGYLKKFGIPKKPGDLLAHRYITHSMRRPDDVLEFKGRLSLRIKPYFRVNDAMTLYNCALNGMGIIKLYHYVMEESLRKGELVEILSKYSEGEIPIYVAYLHRKYLPSKIRAFIDFFTKLL